MKKNSAIVLMLLIPCLIFPGCSASDRGLNIPGYWKTEYVSDLDGNILDKEQDTQLVFSEDGSFVLSDRADNLQYRGNYVVEKVGTSYKLDLHCEKEGITISGVSENMMINLQ